MAKRRQPPQPRLIQGSGAVVVDRFRDKYHLVSQLDFGGSGLVFRGHPAGKPDYHVAIKFYLPTSPTLFEESSLRALWLPDDEDIFASEFAFLKETRHPGVQELVTYGELPEAASFFASGTTKYPLPPDYAAKFIVSKLIPGFPLHRWLPELLARVKSPIRTVVPDGSGIPDKPDAGQAREMLLRCLLDVLDTLSFIHEVRQYQHSDLRLPNIVVHSAANRAILVDFGYAQCFDLAALRAQRPKTQIRLLSEQCPEELVTELRELMKRHGSNSVPRDELRPVVFPGLDLYHFGHVLKDVLATDDIRLILSSLDVDFLTLMMRRLISWRSAKGATAREYHSQLAKLAPGYWAVSGMPVSQVFGDTLRRVALPCSSVWLTHAVERILDTHSFRRLQHLTQLSLLGLVYPGASQTRFEHSLAVYDNAQRLTANLLQSPRFRLLFDNRSVEHFHLCALLHDINHFPFLHYFQELKIRKFESIDLLNMFCAGVDTSDSPSINDLIADRGLDPSALRAILAGPDTELSDPVHQFVRSALNSGADLDKLAYVHDDARTTGQPAYRLA